MTASAELNLGLLRDPSDLEAAFERHNIPVPTRDLIRQVLRGDPVRRVGGGARNVVVRYASRKMRLVIQAESRTVEGAFVQQAESDPNVLLYFCQPLKLTVYVIDKRGRRRRIRVVVDFLMLNEDGFVLVECKSLDELRRDSQSPHPRFVRDGERWRWPAAEEAARALGLGFLLFTSEDVNPIYLRNLRYLADFATVESPCDSDRLEAIVDCVKRAASVRLVELLASPQFESACIWWLVARQRIWVDLERERLFEPDQAWVHASEARMLAQRHIGSSAASPDPHAACTGGSQSAPVILEPGARLLWHDAQWTVLHRGSAGVDLQRDDASLKVVTVPLDDAERLMSTGAWRGDPSCVDQAVDAAREYVVSRATEQDHALALERYRIVRHRDEHGEFPPGTTPEVGRRYLRWYRNGEKRLRSGYLGLIRFRGRRPGTRDLPAPQAQALQEVVEQFADDKSSGRASAAYSRLTALCQERQLNDVPCEATVRREIAKLSVPGLTRARRGARAAYQVQGPAPVTADVALRHGDRVFEVGHIDHALIDLPLVSSRTGVVLGRPWLTVLLDSYSRMPLAFHLSFDPPSRASVGATLYDCVRRHNRLPDAIVFDQALEFHAHMTESALARLGIHKLERPARSPRFGSELERFFESLNSRFIHELPGNTKLLATGRELSSSHHPNRLASRTLPMLHEALSHWLFEVYPTLTHGTHGAPPGEVFEKSLARSGERLARYIRDDLTLRMLFAQPSSRGDKRKVDPVRGIVVDHLRYWHDDFQYGDVAGSDVDVKIDVAECSILFAYVRNRWVICRLVDGDADLHGRTWRQVRMACAALRAQRREGRAARAINADIIGAFLREVDKDSEIALQAMRDAEAVGLGPPSLRAVRPSVRLAASDGVRTGAAPPQQSDSGTSQSSDDSDEPDADYDDVDEFDVR